MADGCAATTEALLVERVERRAIGASNLTLSVSSGRRGRVRNWGALRGRVVSNGVDCEAYGGLPTGRASSDAPIVLYVGARPGRRML